MRDDRNTAPDQGPVQSTPPITLSFILHSLIAIEVIPFIAVCGHFLLVLLLVGIMCKHDDAYSLADYASTYVASALGLVIFTVLRISIGVPRIPTHVWLVCKVIAPPIGSLAMRLLALADPELGIVDGPHLLDPASMLVAALVGQVVVWIVVRLISTQSFWMKISGPGGPGWGA